MPKFNPPEDRGWMGDRSRGASMGRPSRSGYRDPKTGEWVELEVTENAAPFRLSRVRMVGDGAYDSGGAYWGIGDPLYHYEGPTSDIEGYVRGRTREAAKAAVRAIHPRARFYR